MAGVATEESGAGSSFEGASVEQQCQSGEALAEWRSSEQVESRIASTSPPYWDDDDEDGGLKPSQLYGRYTWKIDKFSQINKKELRSSAFEVGGYKWYILIYPQGCDVSNHLSLFLCVSQHEKLLPGWSHFAQFTIAVVNKDPKKSKYSDTLHRFWKKEHDWGWKKFMELSKVLDGFLDADTLIIKAQVQVIRERAERPFRCLDCQYRRELVRVYLKNVEQICGRFMEERRTKLGKLIEDKARWSSICSFWLSMDQSSRRRMSREKKELVLRVVVKHFFIEKEVTSTLVMDSLYSGLKALEGQNKGKMSKGKYVEAEEPPNPIVCIEKDTFVLVDDVLLMLERAAVEPLPPKDEKGPQNRTKEGGGGEEFNKDSIERDERQLTELGRRTIEIFVLAQIFSKIEVSYQEAVALKKQEELIREEEAAWLAESEQKAKRGVDKDKKSKKKQGKQKRNNRKGKDKGRDDKSNNFVEDKIEQDSPTAETKDLLAVEPEMMLEKIDAVEDVSDVSDSLDCLPEMLPPDSEDTDGTNGLSGVQNGIEVRSFSTMDDSSSTCSSDSVPSVVGPKGNSGYQKTHRTLSREKNKQSKLTSETADWVNGEVSQPSKQGYFPNDASRSSKTVGSISQAAVGPLQDKVVNGPERLFFGKKEEATGSSQSNISIKSVVNVEVIENKAARMTSPPTSPSKNIPSQKLESKLNSATEPKMAKNPSSDSPKKTDTSNPLSNSAENGATFKPDPQKLATPKPVEKPNRHQSPIVSEKPTMQHVPVMSRPLSAPLAPGPRPSPSISMVQTPPVLARSASAAGRLGPEPSGTQSYIPQSYRNAITGGPVNGSSSVYANSGISAFVSAPPFSPHSSNGLDSNPTKPNLSFGMMSHHDMQQSGPVWTKRGLERDLSSVDVYNPTVSNRSRDHPPSVLPAGTSGRQSHAVTDEFPHIDIINDLLDEEHVKSGHQTFSNGPHSLGPLCRFDRTWSYQDDVYQHCYGSSESPYDMVSDMIPQASARPYVNGPVDAFMHNQWQMARSEIPYLNVRNTANGGYTYYDTNSYAVFRPSNGL